MFPCPVARNGAELRDCSLAQGLANAKSILRTLNVQQSDLSEKRVSCEEVVTLVSTLHTRASLDLKSLESSSSSFEQKQRQKTSNDPQASSPNPRPDHATLLEAPKVGSPEHHLNSASLFPGLQVEPHDADLLASLEKRVVSPYAPSAARSCFFDNEGAIACILIQYWSWTSTLTAV